MWTHFPAPRRPLLGGAALFLLAAMACGAPPKYHRIHGRIELPTGVDLSRIVGSSQLTVVVSQNGRIDLGAARPAGAALITMGSDGAFDLYVSGDGRFDLQAGTMNVVSAPGTGPTGTLTPAEVERLADSLMNREGPGRVVNRVGEYEGFVRGVRPGATDVVIRLVPQVTKRIGMRVVDPDGLPAVHVRVSWNSMADWIYDETDADGRAEIAGVPVREWSVVARPPTTSNVTLVAARARCTPTDGNDVELRLRRGVPIRVRLGHEPRGDVVLEVGAAPDSEFFMWPWNPDAAGESVVLAEPDWRTVEITAVRVTNRTKYSAERTIIRHVTASVAAGTVVDLAAGP